MANERKFVTTTEPTWVRSPAGAYGGIVSSVLFLLGSILVIVFLFLPLIDAGRIARDRAQISVGDDQDKQADADLADEIATLKLEGTQAAERTQRRADEHRNWQATRSQLEQSIHKSEMALAGATYAYRWGMMAGFLCLAFASLGLVHFGPTAILRIVGAVVIATLVGLVFLSYLWPRHGA